MVLTLDKVVGNVSTSPWLRPNVSKGKFRRSLSKAFMVWASLFPRGLNACTIDADRHNWNAPRFGVGMFHIKAMMIGNELFLIKDDGLDENAGGGNVERLVLELSVKYDISYDKKISKGNWSWSGMTPFIKGSNDYLSLLDEDVNGISNDSMSLKCRRLCMNFNYAPELLTSRDCPNGIRYTYGKNKGTRTTTSVTSYVLKQYFNNLDIEVDDFIHNAISGGQEDDLYIFNGGIITPKEAIKMLDDTYRFTLNPNTLSNRA